MSTTAENATQPTTTPELEALASIPSNQLIEQAISRSKEANLPYEGGLYPPEAWVLFSRGDAVLVDVRTSEELQFVGRVPGAKHAAWVTGTAMLKNPRFLRELEKAASKDAYILLLCRSGKRSALAAEAAKKAGFLHVFNVLEGFEGDLDDAQQRVHFGWRRWGLPWVQD